MRTVSVAVVATALLGSGAAVAADIPGNSSTRAVIVAGSTQIGAPDNSVRSTIDTANDHDWFRLRVTKGQTYAGYSYGADSDVNGTDLVVRNGAGRVIATRLPSGDAANVNFTATYTGTVFLDVFGGNPDPEFNAYTLDMNFDCAPVYSKTLCGTMTERDRHGYHDYAGDHDFYKVSLLRGRTYRITLDGRCSASIRVVDRTGKVVLRPVVDAETPRDVAARFTAGYSGFFYVDLAGLDDFGSDDGCGDYNYSIKKLF